MRTLAEQIANKCVHFTGLLEDRCEVGIPYDEVRDTSASPYRFPCFKDNCLPCERKEFLSDEQVAHEVEQINLHTNRTMKAMRAAADDAKVHGFKKGSGGVGNLKCPCCETGTLHYSVAGYNGHMHGRCSTPECVSWMQ